MKLRNLVLVSLAAFGAAALPATPAHALLVKVSINFGPTITGPDNGTLIVTANPGDLLIITWALGTDTDIQRYHGLIFGVEGLSGVDTAEISRVVGSALELTGQGFDPCCNPNAPFSSGGEFGYFASSDGAPIGFAGNGGELWRIEYVVTNPVTDEAADISYRFDDVFQCTTFTGGPLCPGTPGSASTPFPSRRRFSCSDRVSRVSPSSAGSFEARKLSIPALSLKTIFAGAGTPPHAVRPPAAERPHSDS